MSWGLSLYFGNGCIVLHRILHYLSVQLLKHVLSVIAREGAFLMKFSATKRRQILSVSLKGTEATGLYAHCFPLDRRAAAEELCGADVTIFEHCAW